MNPMRRTHPYLLLATAAIGVSVTSAAAQTASPAPPAGWAHHGDHAQGLQDWRAEHAKMEQRRLAELHTKLNLNPGQEPAWQAFVTGLQAARPAEQPDAAPGQERLDWDKMKMQTTPEHLDDMLAHIDDMRAHLAQMDQVVKTFYAVLSKNQQTIFDDNFRAMGPHHGGPHHEGPRHEGPRQEGPRHEGPRGDGGMEHGRMGDGPMGPPPMDPPQM